MEYRKPPEEYRLPPEYGTAEEYTDESQREYAPKPVAENAVAKRHKRIKRLMFAPIASIIAALSVIFASVGYDPLGIDFLNAGSPPGKAVDTTLPVLPPAEGGDPVGTVNIFAHVTYVPTGETYLSPSTGTAALSDVLTWVISKGGDGGTIVYQKSTVVKTGVEFSDDAIVVGDPDDLDNVYVAQGTMTFIYRRDVYYLAYAIGTALPSSGKADAAFPTLGNLNPDFAGDYAWGGSGSEEYVRFKTSAAKPYEFIEMGAAWAGMGETDADGNFVPYKLTAPANAVYDKASNTLTLTDFTAHELDVNLMGNGFRIRLVGENRLDRLCIWGASYGGSVTFTGSGSLTVNEDGNSPDGVGIRLQGEFSQSCLMIDREVTLDVYGEPAILIGATSMEKALYYLSPVRMTGGVGKNGDFAEYSAPVYDENGNFTGYRPAAISEISKETGGVFYDYSVVDEEGTPSTRVYFAPAAPIA